MNNPTATKKEEHLHIRFTEPELSDVRAAAGLEELPVSLYARRILLKEARRACAKADRADRKTAHEALARKEGR